MGFSKLLLTWNRFSVISCCFIRTRARCRLYVIHNAGILSSDWISQQFLLSYVVLGLVASRIWSIFIYLLNILALGKSYFLLSTFLLRIILSWRWSLLNPVVNLSPSWSSDTKTLALMPFSNTKSIIHRPWTVIIIVCEDFTRCKRDRKCRWSRIHDMMGF